MTYYSISALINFLTSFLLGIFILRKNYLARLNRNLFFWCFSVAAWSLFYFFWQISKNESDAILFSKLLMLGAIWVPIAYFKVVVIFLDIEVVHRKLINIIYFLSTLFSLLLMSPYMVSGVKPVVGFLYWPQPGFAYSLFLLMFFGLLAYSIVLSVKALSSASTIKRAQIKLMLLGIAISIIGGSTNYFLWYGIPIKPFGNIFASTYVLFTVYAIAKYRLMDIKFVLRKYSVYLFSLLVIIVPTATLQYFYPKQLGKFSSFSHIFLIIFAISVFPFVKDKFYKFANKYFFSSLYDSREVISRISEQLRSTIEVDKMYQFISQAIVNSFHVRAFGVLIYNEKRGEYFVQYNNNSEDASFLRLLSNKNYQYVGLKISQSLCDSYLRKNIPIIVDDLKDKELEKYKNDIEYWQAIGIEILVPLIVKDRNIGLIVLSAKESGDLYNNEDLYILKVIGAQVAISLENALLYQETLNFNANLKNEVAKQTRELTEANEKLKQLDKAKSEFISIASHQLRTPLSIIKGYISMILEGNFGELTPGEKDSLEKVYKSNERIIALVEDLLNISRMESGRLQFTFEARQLQDLVVNICDELRVKAKEKNLKFEFVKSTTKLPLANMDETKMRQVIMNLIDNSIKYTPSGSVAVSLKKQKDSILFCVSDSGVGIKPEDMSNLFKKFSRGSGSSLINAEGTGLGLFVAKKMIEAHSGRIWAESAGKNMGSQFYFEIPYLKKSRIAKK